MKKIIYIIAVLLIGCGYNDHDGYTESDLFEELTPTLTIRELYRLCQGHQSVSIDEPIVVEGAVIANDFSGNFYRTFIINDASASLEIKVGGYDLHTLYPVGRVVGVKLDGLTCTLVDGILQVGVAGNGYMPSSYFADKHIVRTSKFRQPHIATFDRIADLPFANVGDLIRVKGLKAESDTWADRYKYDITARDSFGDSLFVYTSPYADFASEVVPCGKVNITGVLMKKGDVRRLKIRDLSDVEILP